MNTNRFGLCWLFHLPFFSTFLLWLEIINIHPMMHIKHLLHLRNVLCWSLFFLCYFCAPYCYTLVLHLFLKFLPSTLPLAFSSVVCEYLHNPLTLLLCMSLDLDTTYICILQTMIVHFFFSFSLSLILLYPPLSLLFLFYYLFLACKRLAPSRSKNFNLLPAFGMISKRK